MSRNEFTRETKRDAWDRSGERCEAEGPIYGLPSGVRCNVDLNLGVNYDHVDPDANSKDRNLENCCACCPKCHLWKTANRDAPLIAKTNHQADMRRGIDKRKGPPMMGTKASGWKRSFSGEVTRR